MMASVFSKVFGTANDREIKRLSKIMQLVNAQEDAVKTLTDDALRGKTGEFRERLERGESLDNLIPEAFAVAREASVRTLGMRPFDVQIIGGLALHEGSIAEMKTGEGKTLAATLPVYLNALEGKGVHVVTVNDYLAKRDSEWMGEIYRFLGMSVGCIVHGLNSRERREVYTRDITYATNNELGFDYLRDNMKLTYEAFVQRGHRYAIVDEVDSILIDEARTPLIISGPTEDSTDKYYVIDRVIPRLKAEEDYTQDEKHRSVTLTEEGIERVQRALNVENLYDPDQMDTLHHVNQALRAHVVYKRDRDYVVQNDEVLIVDEHTGRLMPGRRYSDGLHQALEAKEGVKIENENQTLASVTFQNFFRMYDKLAGMTGTADTEAVEFKKIYDLDVIVVPTNVPVVREDHPDIIYRTKVEKDKAVIEHIAECHEKGQPVLVGTISIERNEMLSRMLSRRGITHQILNAKHHGREAEIVAQAGRYGAVTLATNMAGRGTDIVLGGNPEFLAHDEWRLNHGEEPIDEESAEYKDLLAKAKAACKAARQVVLAAGGLAVIGTERHESRRIDNQLRGRSGRQGDPGMSVFYLALDDDLMRIFGSERMDSMLAKLGVKENEPIFHKWISKAIANAQEKVEGHNFDIRKRLIEYDDVMNQQREIIYQQRRHVLGAENMREDYFEIADDAAADLVDEYIDPKTYPEEWPWDELAEAVRGKFGVTGFEYSDDEKLKVTVDALREDIAEAVKKAYREKEELVGEELMRKAEKFFMLTTIDADWKNHLYQMDRLRDGIGLRGYAQQNPLLMYKKEGFEMFQSLSARINEQALQKMLLFSVEDPREIDLTRRRQKEQKTVESHARVSGMGPAPANVGQPVKDEPPTPRERTAEEVAHAQAKLKQARRKAKQKRK
ncbi:MAG: preprotein translocase subunit SecA [Deltaproteobacteria bacterium]|nr:preprotein translocase subunit SecA [Deltaproteobacteria bacterium]